MDDYIKRESVINTIENLPTWWADDGGFYGGERPPMTALLDPNDTLSAIEAIPSADVAEVRHGKWVEKKGVLHPLETDGICTECGYETGFYNFFNFCPNCGADMRG